MTFWYVHFAQVVVWRPCLLIAQRSLRSHTIPDSVWQRDSLVYVWWYWVSSSFTLRVIRVNLKILARCPSLWQKKMTIHPIITQNDAMKHAYNLISTGWEYFTGSPASQFQWTTGVTPLSTWPEVGASSCPSPKSTIKTRKLSKTGLTLIFEMIRI